MEIPERKKRLRREIRARLRHLFEGDAGLAKRRCAEEKLVDGLNLWIRQMQIHQPIAILAFWPTLPEEPDFRQWLKARMETDAMIGLPRLNWDERILEFRQVSEPDRDLEFDDRGLAQPRADLPRIGPDMISAILVPGLAFDMAGRRLGRGAGFYDRTLDATSRLLPRLGLCFEEQIVETVPTDAWDQKVDFLLTPESGLRACGNDPAGHDVPFKT